MTGSALGGNMMRSRLKKIASIAGAGAVATVGTLALNPFSANADGAPTSTSVSAPATLVTGHAVNFTAVVAPTTAIPGTKPTGTVTFTIVGSDSSSVACAGGVNDPAINGKGKAVCKISSGTLGASASPYSVTAVYSGDSNFAGSTGTASQTVSEATTHIALTFSPKVTSGSATTVTATLSGGSGVLPTGDVAFDITSPTDVAKTAPLYCGGVKTKTANFPVLSSNGAPKPEAVATCSLDAGWFNVPASSTKDPHPVATWQIEVNYDGDHNYGVAQTTKKGSAKG
jgi:hypothetical protein